MIGHYQGEVFRDADSQTRHFAARFWSARTATATTCFAGIGLVVFVMVTAGEATVVLFAWAVLWMTLLVSSLLLINDRHQAKVAWGTSTCVAFLFAVMVMHHAVPVYSRSQTLFGSSSPLAMKLAIAKKPPIATVDHEFSEVPFYLRRSDIPNFADVGDSGLRDFVTENQPCLLIVEDRVNPRSIRDRLPPGTKIVEVTRRGVSRIYEARLLPAATQIATNPTHSLDEVQR